MRSKTTFKKGNKTAGQGKRGKGKVTVTLKEAILNSFDELGGTQWLVALAKKSPSAYCQLLAKVIPTSLKHDWAELPLFPDQVQYPFVETKSTDEKL